MARDALLGRFLRSTSVRLSLRFAFLYSFVTALVFAGAYKLAEYETTDWIKEQLVDEEAAFLAIYEDQGLDGVIEGLTKYGAFNFEDHRIYLLLDANGQRIVGNVDTIGRTAKADYVDASAIGFSGHNDNEAFGYILRNVNLGENTLVLGTSTYFLLELLEGFGGGLIIGFVVVIMVGSGVGIAVGRRTETRLRQVSGTLERVAKGDLEARVSLHHSDADDLARLSREINSTISQLEKMVESQNQITADIAHDLRTPMQRLRQRLEAIGQSEELADHLSGQVYQAIEAADDLIETFHALLRISQIEAGAQRESFREVDLTAVLSRIEDAYSAVAEEHNQTLVFTGGAAPHTVLGDHQLLTQMVANVVENALRHCPSKAHVEMSLLSTSDYTSFTVCDNGPGIPERDREKVFRRFYRVEKSRTTSGNGLGFSLVKAIADLHCAKVALSDNQPGLKVTVLFSK